MSKERTWVEWWSGEPAFNVHEIHNKYHNGTQKELSEAIQRLSPSDINIADKEGDTLLHKACFNGQPNLAATLLEKGADPFIKDNKGFSALSLLAYTENHDDAVETFQQILSKHKDAVFKLPETEVKTLVSLMLENRNIELANNLLDSSIYKEVIKNQLFKESKNNQLDSLLEIENNEHAKYELLEQKILNGEHENVKYMLNHASFFQNKMLNGKNLVQTAFSKAERLQSNVITLQQNEPLSTEEQIKISSYKNKIDDIYQSMNHLLVHKSFNQPTSDILTTAYKNLKELPEDASSQEKEQKKQLFETIKNYNTEYLKTNGKDLLILAAKYGDEELYKELQSTPEIIKQYENNLTNAEKIEIVGNAAATGSIYIAQQFNLDAKTIKVNKETNSTLLMEACKSGNPELIRKYITQYQLSPTEIDTEGNNALHYLATSSKNNSNYARSLEILLSDTTITPDSAPSIKIPGANIDAQNKKGLTPLMLAVIDNNPNLVRDLIAKGADVNIEDERGNNALIYACRLNNKATIEAVLSATNLDVTHKNKQGVSAYAISMRRDLDEFRPEDNSTNISKTKEKPTKGATPANTYKGLSQHLLSRGADPYEQAAPSLMDVTFITTLAVGAVKLTNSVNKMVANTPFSGAASIIANITKDGAYTAAYITTRNWVRNKLEEMLLPNEKKLSIKGKIMIGSVHTSGWTSFYSISHGDKLKNNLTKNSKYTNSNDAIYTTEDLVKKLSTSTEADKAWAVEAQKDLQDQYQAIKHRIHNLQKGWQFPWKAWQRKELTKALTNIETASTKLIESNLTGAKANGQTFDDTHKELLDIIKDPGKSKQLLKTIINDDKPDEVKRRSDIINRIVDSVVKKEILVSPETYHEFCQFHQEIKKYSQNISNRSALMHDSSILPLEYKEINDRNDKNYYKNPTIPNYGESQIELFKSNIRIPSDSKDEVTDIKDQAIKLIEEKLKEQGTGTQLLPCLSHDFLTEFAKNMISSAIAATSSTDRSRSENVSIGINTVANTVSAIFTIVGAAQSGDQHAQWILNQSLQAYIALQTSISSGTTIASNAIQGVAATAPLIGGFISGCPGYTALATGTAIVGYQVWKAGGIQQAWNNLCESAKKLWPKSSEASIPNIKPNIAQSTVDDLLPTKEQSEQKRAIIEAKRLKELGVEAVNAPIRNSSVVERRPSIAESLIRASRTIN